jgi:integrase
MSGHIRKRGANSWELKFEAGVDPMTGLCKTAYRTVRGAKREARAELVRLLGEASIARPPRVADTEIEIASEDEITAVLEWLKKRNPQLYVLATLALATGARRDELCALCWKDFDAQAGMLRIERSLETTHDEGLRVKSPKTKHGRRTINIAVAAVEALRAHWKAQGEERLAVGLGRAGPDDLIFAMADGSALKPDTLSKDWLRATKAATGRPINLHSLRHHHASNLIRAGVDILTVSRRLGHASATITLGVVRME